MRGVLSAFRSPLPAIEAPANAAAEAARPAARISRRLKPCFSSAMRYLRPSDARLDPASRLWSSPGETSILRPMQMKIRAWSWLALAALGIVGLALHATTFLPFLADDAQISLRSSERVVEGKGLTWTDGERVEGYSNLLCVLAAALLHLLGMDSILAVRLLGFLGMGAAILALAWSQRHAFQSETLPFPRAALPAAAGVAAM